MGPSVALFWSPEKALNFHHNLTSKITCQHLIPRCLLIAYFYKVISNSGEWRGKSVTGNDSHSCTLLPYSMTARLQLYINCLGSNGTSCVYAMARYYDLSDYMCIIDCLLLHFLKIMTAAKYLFT